MSLATHVEENRNGCNNNGQDCGHEKHRRVFRCGSSPASELPPRAPQAVHLLRSSELRLTGPSPRVVHQSCVCVYPCVPVWSAVSALPISFPIHQRLPHPPCLPWQHPSDASWHTSPLYLRLGRRNKVKKKGSAAQMGENCFHVWRRGPSL